WRKGFAQLSGNQSLGPVLTRLETFLGPKPIRYMVSQRENKLDFSEIMDTGRIVLAKLSQGLIGKENSYLLGSLLVSRFQQTAMSRQAQAVRRDYWLYADEFQNFITPSMAEILAGARKYRLGLILAHQELRQLERDREVAGAVFNCCTRVVFRVADDDARKLAEGFSFFETRDIQNLDTGQAICRIERSDHDFNLKVPFPENADLIESASRRQEVITASRGKYGTPRAVVETLLRPKPEAPSHKPDDSGDPPGTPPSSPKPPLPAAPVPPSISPKSAQPPKAPDTPNPTQESTLAQEPTTPRDLGRGGELHKSIQERLQAEARALGFLAEVEKQVSGDSNQAADLLLRRGELRIAVEIALTTTTNQEFGNVKKNLDAGFE